MDIDPVICRPPREFDRPLIQPLPGIANMGPREQSMDKQGIIPNSSNLSGVVEHVVEDHETLTTLAVKYDMSVHDIRLINRLHHSAVFAGQVVLVKDPKNSSDFSSPAHALCASTQSSTTSDEGSDDADTQPSSPFMLVSRDIHQTPRMTSGGGREKEFFKDDWFRIKVLLMTRKHGLVPGMLESTTDYIGFTPDSDCEAAREPGAQPLSLLFEYEDMLTPVSQRHPPSLKKGVKFIERGYAGHRDSEQGFNANPPSAVSASDDVMSGSSSSNKKPVFFGLRVQLVFGIHPTPETVQYYWFAVMPQWIDCVYDHVFAHAQYNEEDIWEEVHREELIDSTTGGYLDESLGQEIVFHSPSKLLTPATAQQISKHLPMRLQYSDWVCAYSTYEHGISLMTLYRKLAPVDDTREPCVMVVRDSRGHVFGCYTTDSWRPCDNYFGSGECMVFKMYPEVKFFKWTHKNKLFMTATDDYIMAGGGRTIESGTGAAALWLDADLMHGCSNCSQTFDNDCLASSEDFLIDGLEVWRFVSQD